MKGSQDLEAVFSQNATEAMLFWKSVGKDAGLCLDKWINMDQGLNKTLESPSDSKEIQPVHPKGDQSWLSIGRTDAEAETPILWPPDAKNWLIEKDPDAEKD